jgi:multiple sugar transport system substrate-binding protein
VVGGGVPGPARRELPGWLREYQLVGLAVGLVAGIVLSLLPALLRPERGIEPGELVIMMDRDQSVGEQRKRLIGEWDELQEDVSVRIIEVPSSGTAAHSQMVAQAQAGGGDVDVYSLDVTWVAEFAKEGWLRPLARSAIDESAFLDNPLSAGIYDGELWALPFNTDAALLYYRKDLLPEPPATWEDLAVAWQGAVEAGEPLQAGYAGQFADYEGFTVNVLEAVLAHDPGALEAERWAEGGAAWAGALEQLAAGFAPDERQQRLILPESLDHREDGSLEAFRSRQVLFMRNWPVAYRRLAQVEAEPAAGDGAGHGQVLRPEDVGVTTLPGLGEGAGGGGVSVLGGQSLGLADRGDQPRAAQRLIEFLTSPRSQEKLFVEGGFVPTQKVVYRDLTVNEAYGYLATVEEAVEQARPRPVHPRYALISETIRREVRGYLEAASRGEAAGTDPDELARRLADSLADAGDGYRR